MIVAGLVLAAGAGTRFGMPKALALDASGRSLLAATIDTLRFGGCDSVTVVLGAGGELAAANVADAEIVHAPDWQRGLSGSLSVGLEAIETSDAEAALIMLVDLPDVTAAVVRRVLGATPIRPGCLLRALFNGEPGHPVLIGRDHWVGVRELATGDRGARDYLVSHSAGKIECGDLATGKDVDIPRFDKRVVRA